MKFYFFTLLIIALTPISSWGIEGKHSFCTSSESWKFSDEIPKDYVEMFKKTVENEIPPTQGFSEALDLRRRAETPIQKLFAEYWISRSILSGGLPHVAHQGFITLLKTPSRPGWRDIQISSLECLSRIQKKYPTLTFDAHVHHKIIELFDLKPTGLIKKSLQKSALISVRDLISQKNIQKNLIESILNKMKDGGKYEELAQGLYSSSISHHSKTILWLEKFLNPKTNIPSDLKKYLDSANLLMARALYSSGQYERSIWHLKHIQKNSNELARGLSELSWAFLQSERYAEAIGTAINLQAGGLRGTFTPEAPMVMAMALNEVCHYPKSIQAISLFKDKYKDSYFWLSDWYKNRNSSSQNIYPKVISYIKKSASVLNKKDKSFQFDVPVNIVSEWIRTPLFLSRQEEINLIYKEKKQTKKLSKQGAFYQNKMAENLIKEARGLKKRYILARKEMAPGDPIPAQITDDLKFLKKQVLHYRRMQQGAPIWHVIMNAHQKKAPELKKTLVSRINRDLKRITENMYFQLEDISENSQLIEVEIYNGATKDIIWQNAHPDYDKIAEALKDQDRRLAKKQVMDWGTVQASMDGLGEIWEDELGDFKADIYDNCESKDRYLKVKRTQMLAKLKQSRQGKK
ncbi:MAG: hypothetical protein CL678_14840 [Bdellovibrionaceae bacterium]|nr:hypothetical protein [Pseudobdellovibrionaceae bacterium]|tara:strand:+ start:3488 stop:5383 length:1896 start_codon:yes stop_codon:yes gene_type:complete